MSIKAFCSGLLTNILLRIRNYLITKYPIIQIESYIGNKQELISINVNSMSYVVEQYVNGKLRTLKTCRTNFGYQYNVYFDRKGKRIATFYSNGDFVQINHKALLVRMFKQGNNLNINIQEKQPNTTRYNHE